MQSTISTGSFFGRFGFLFPWRNAHLVEQTAGEVARQCEAQLGRRVRQRAGEMSVAEIRGYVRAIAASCIGDEVDQAISRRRLKASMRDRIADAAVDRLVHMVAHDVLAFEPQPRPRTMAA